MRVVPGMARDLELGVKVVGSRITRGHDDLA